MTERIDVWVAPGTSIVQDSEVGRSVIQGTAASLRASLDEASLKAGPLLGMAWGPGQVEVAPHAWERCVAAAGSGVALVYGDYATQSQPVQTHDPEPGSLREEFDAGPLWLARIDAVRGALRELPAAAVSASAIRYGLRLGLLRRGALRMPEQTARVSRVSVEDMFGYVRPDALALQTELEAVFTDHLRRIGAWLPPRSERFIDPEEYPVAASVVIPVRDRVHTIGDAVTSSLSQRTSVPFNVLVVDNHSSDGTAARAREAGDARLQVLTPTRSDLGIGGCWNVAAYSALAGRYLVQLDSDDVFATPESLQTMVYLIASGPWAMAVGAYRTVDIHGRDVAPGLVDHREWTDENGHNNLLRVSGIGAPRVFATGFVRGHPFPNVCYGEDYAMALRVSREFYIARTYDPVYVARRWEGNTDHATPPSVAWEREAYKNRLRTVEVMARAAGARV